MPKFQRRHYIAIAEVFAEVRADQQMPLFELTALNSVIARTANLLARDNPRFDRSKFLTACKYDGQ